ncbi:MAG: hypothetical protein KatS3mg071_1590 [Meiothermus sp.]|nr:MAG: hypothetical protein KatS3mg071_1590 [Meiothermus sp.]
MNKAIKALRRWTCYLAEREGCHYRPQVLRFYKKQHHRARRRLAKALIREAL